MSLSDPKQNFFKNLKRLASESGHTQREIAEAIGVSPQLLNVWISGKGAPRMDKIQGIANFFKVSLEDLLCDQEDILIKTDAELLMDKIKKLDREKIKMLETYLDFLLQKEG